jgi:hypothetical protein
MDIMQLYGKYYSRNSHLSRTKCRSMVFSFPQVLGRQRLSPQGGSNSKMAVINTSGKDFHGYMVAQGSEVILARYSSATSQVPEDTFDFKNSKRRPIGTGQDEG